MKRFVLASVALWMITATTALATENSAAPAPATPAPAAPASAASGPMIHEITLEEARKRAHERADMLDKMTQAEWDDQQKKRREFIEKFSKMSAAERQNYFKQLTAMPQDKSAKTDKALTTDKASESK